MVESNESAPVKRVSDWDDELLLELAERYDTPLYVIDLDRVEENYRRFSKAFPDASVMYAAKAHTGRAVLERIVEAGGTIECAAAGELSRSIDAGADPDELQYTAVNPPDRDLDVAAELGERYPGLTVTIGASDTLERLIDRGYTGRIAIRVNPGIGTGHHEKVATGGDAKFGIPYDEVPSFASTVGERCDLVGIHAHIGSGVLMDGLDRHCQAIAKIGDLARRIDGLEFVDVGGGFGVPYRESEEPLDLAVTADAIREAVGPIDATLKLEPGRYIVADAGAILTRVNTIKPTPVTTVVGVDASLSTLIRPAMFDAYHPIYNVSAPNRDNETVTVGGPVCTSADVFARDRSLSRPKRNDVLSIGMVGAYGYELANQFHSQPRPAEVAIDNGSDRVVRRRETMEDVTRLEQ